MPLSQQFAFIGGGVMAEGLIRALLDSGLCAPAQIAASDVAAPRRDALSALGIRAVAANAGAADGADVVVIAVKPTVVAAALADLRELLSARHLVVSIAAGVPTADIEACLAGEVPVVRVMPNIAVQVRAGAAAIAGGTAAGEEHLALVEQIFSAAGRCVRVRPRIRRASRCLERPRRHAGRHHHRRSRRSRGARCPERAHRSRSRRHAAVEGVFFAAIGAFPVERHCKLQIANCKLQIERPAERRRWRAVDRARRSPTLPFNLQFAICNLQFAMFFYPVSVEAPQ
jgi:hypothetical protein